MWETNYRYIRQLKAEFFDTFFICSSAFLYYRDISPMDSHFDYVSRERAGVNQCDICALKNICASSCTYTISDAKIGYLRPFTNTSVVNPFHMEAIRDRPNHPPPLPSTPLPKSYVLHLITSAIVFLLCTVWFMNAFVEELNKFLC